MLLRDFLQCSRVTPITSIVNTDGRDTCEHEEKLMFGSYPPPLAPSESTIFKLFLVHLLKLPTIAKTDRSHQKCHFLTPF